MPNLACFSALNAVRRSFDREHFALGEQNLYRIDRHLSLYNSGQRL
jgi:hypothetical protein